jgi:hypothetical protein
VEGIQLAHQKEMIQLQETIVQLRQTLEKTTRPPSKSTPRPNAKTAADAPPAGGVQPSRPGKTSRRSDRHARPVHGKRDRRRPGGDLS